MGRRRTIYDIRHETQDLDITQDTRHNKRSINHQTKKRKERKKLVYIYLMRTVVYVCGVWKVP